MDQGAGKHANEQIRVVALPEPFEVDEVRQVLTAAEAADGEPPVSEQGRLRLRSPRGGVRHLLARDAAGSLVGYGQVDATATDEPPTAEFVVDPRQRGLGHGRRLAEAVLAHAGSPATPAPDGSDRSDAPDGSALGVWAHGGHPAARHLADALGLDLVRELRQLRRPLPPGGAGLPEPVVPPGVRLRPFVPGRDEAAWLTLNAAAFAHHPEQGAWTERDLLEREAEPWFDPAGFFLAERDGRLVGYHWTKVDGDVGEVYVVGVSPSEQGGGLGRALTAVGLRHLAADRGLHSVLLYVDADNAPATRVYGSLGFTTHSVDLMYVYRAPRS